MWCCLPFCWFTISNPLKLCSIVITMELFAKSTWIPIVLPIAADAVRSADDGTLYDEKIKRFPLLRRIFVA